MRRGGCNEDHTAQMTHPHSLGLSLQRINPYRQGKRSHKQLPSHLSPPQMEPDNMQGYEIDSGYNTGFYKCPAGTGYTTGCLTDYNEWKDFNLFLATEASRPRLSAKGFGAETPTAFPREGALEGDACVACQMVGARAGALPRSPTRHRLAHHPHHPTRPADRSRTCAGCLWLSRTTGPWRKTWSTRTTWWCRSSASSMESERWGMGDSRRR